MRKNLGLYLMILFYFVTGCSGPASPTGVNQPEKTSSEAHPQANTAQARFNPKDFDDTLAWVKSIQRKLEGISNPLSLKEAMQSEQSKFDKVNGTIVEWRFPVTALGVYGKPYVIFDGQKMNYGDNMQLDFRGGKYGMDAGRVWLFVDEHITKDQYRPLKQGVPATIKGKVTFKFDEGSPFTTIIIEDVKMP